jgi:N-acetylglucosaminyldiphosphoundecaprenol N-acetyl-beta-D-mannosaminyltransferase
MSKPEYIDQVNRASPDLLVLSLGKHGKPWVVKNASKIDRGILSHLGAVINFVAQRIERAPKGLQKLGLEWAWRIFQEPALFRRYSHDAIVLAQLIAFRVLPLKLQRLRAGFRSQGAELRVIDKSNEFIFQLGGTWTEWSLDGLRRALLTASERKTNMAFDLSLLDHMDSAVVGLIIIAYGWQLRNKLGFRISAYSPMVARILSLHCSSYLLDQPLGRTG